MEKWKKQFKNPNKTPEDRKNLIYKLENNFAKFKNLLCHFGCELSITVVKSIVMNDITN